MTVDRIESNRSDESIRVRAEENSRKQSDYDRLNPAYDRANRNADRLSRLEEQVDNDHEAVKKLTKDMESLIATYNMGKGISKFVILCGGIVAGVAAIYSAIGGWSHH